jgi:hypothetical protein
MEMFSAGCQMDCCRSFLGGLPTPVVANSPPRHCYFTIHPQLNSKSVLLDSKAEMLCSKRCESRILVLHGIVLQKR